MHRRGWTRSLCGACALAVVLGVLAMPPRPALAQDAQARWEALSKEVETSHEQNQAGAAIPLAEQALALAREAFGDKDPRTLSSLNILARALLVQGRYADAEPLAREALQGRREVLGPRHPDTLTSQSILSGVLYSQGRYADAEPLAREALPSPPVTRDGSLDRGQMKPAIFNHGEARVPKRRGGGNGQPINRRR
jgi:tetratricopeptide (TPR) repeat protein